MMISDYKVGDKVKIRKVLVGASSGGYVFIENMEKYCGTISKIIEVQGWVIRLECTGDKTGWMPEWIEPAEFLSDLDFEI